MNDPEIFIDYPFGRMAKLLAPLDPPAGKDPLVLSVGEPRLPTPPMAQEVIAGWNGGWTKYPPPAGSDAYRGAVAAWLTKRYGLPDGMIDPDRNVAGTCGSREGLFQLTLLAATMKRQTLPAGVKPLIAMPNPLYHVYYGGTILANADPVFMNTTAETRHMPDVRDLTPDVLDRLAMVILCTPGNPSGKIAKIDVLLDLALLARKHNFILAVDECYSELYGKRAPVGALEACKAIDGKMDNVVTVNSLSKRSSAPGLRCAFVAGDAEIIRRFTMLRNYGGVQMPPALDAAGTALWRDESHVAANRAHYQALFDIADEAFDGWPGYERPEAAFFLWLPVRDDEEAAKAAWTREAIKVMPGRYFSRKDPVTGTVPGEGYIRIALVDDVKTVRDGMIRLRSALDAAGQAPEVTD